MIKNFSLYYLIRNFGTKSGKIYKPHLQVAFDKIKTKKFQKKIEDFDCIVCDTHVKGNGYTNHCPKCLYSLHVDINPGDRMSDCKGIMKPIGIFKKNGKTSLVHECMKCEMQKNNKPSPIDDLSIFSSDEEGEITELGKSDNLPADDQLI